MGEQPEPTTSAVTGGVLMSTELSAALAALNASTTNWTNCDDVPCQKEACTLGSFQTSMYLIFPTPSWVIKTVMKFFQLVSPEAISSGTQAPELGSHPPVVSESQVGVPHAVIMRA